MEHLKIDQGDDFFDSPLMDISDSFEGVSAVYMPDEPLNSLLSYNNDEYESRSFYSYYDNNPDGRARRLSSPSLNKTFRPTKFDDIGDRAIKMMRINSSTQNEQTNNVNRSGSLSEASEPRIIVDTQPPIEVRTRTPSEKRNFSCSVIVTGDYKEYNVKFITVELLYASGNDEIPKQTILGGTKTVTIKPNGVGLFDNLSMSEASTKHKEKEFCLRFVLLDKNGTKLRHSTFSTPFYAYSNTKVLARRREIQLRALSKNFGDIQGGEPMHVIGTPFIKGPSLKLVFRTPHGDIPVTDVELFSETVMFFTLPRYPIEAVEIDRNVPEIKVEVMVTNDGRNFSNALEFFYVNGKNDNGQIRSYL